MRSADGQVSVTANGEIYNWEQLYAERVQGGRAAAASSCDCEVLLHLYQEHGPGFVSELDGMFAFVLVDEGAQTFLAARDPHGKKPLCAL
jgi:asparagine synthase (glutamine-hydrolysing)|eukprot:SAG25_NODE_1527_length_2837_cov_1.697224_5_plen_90_part_00